MKKESLKICEKLTEYFDTHSSSEITRNEVVQCSKYSILTLKELRTELEVEGFGKFLK